MFISQRIAWAFSRSLGHSAATKSASIAGFVMISVLKVCAMMYHVSILARLLRTRHRVTLLHG